MEGVYSRMEQVTRANRRSTKKKGKKKKKTGIILLAIILLVMVALATQINRFTGIMTAFENNQLTTSSTSSETRGILILGIDNDGGGNVEAGHTDSITYIAANYGLKKAYALPIYRDARIDVTCDGTQDNINRIYGNHGINCLAESTSAFLGLPIDNYAIITIDGFIKIIEELGSLELTPKETFCSNYGGDGENYCFTAGDTQEMTPNQVMAYIRYRGASNGENRANRQVQLISAIKDRCMNEMLTCYDKVSPHFSGAFKTNVAVTEMNKLSDVFGGNFDLQTLDVIEGVNEQTATGWSQFVDEADLAAKTEIIRSEIFV